VPVPEHLTINIGGLAFNSLLADWGWLIKPNLQPIMMTAFGDLFLRDETGRVFFLDLKWGQLKQVAESEEEFGGLCEDREQRRVWFIGFLVMELRKLRGNLTARQCYSCKIPMSLGGQLEAENFERSDLDVHYSILSQLHQQTKDLPAGTKIDRVNIVPPPEKEKSWLQRLKSKLG